MNKVQNTVIFIETLGIVYVETKTKPAVVDLLKKEISSGVSRVGVYEDRFFAGSVQGCN